MDTNRSDKERSSYLGKLRNATSMDTCNILGEVGKVTWKKLKSVGDALATVSWSVSAAAAGKALSSGELKY